MRYVVVLRGHELELHVGLLLRLFGPDTKIGQMSARFRYRSCGMRGARIGARYIGPVGGGPLGGGPLGGER